MLLDWREHVELSVTDDSQQQAVMGSICSGFMFRARPHGTLAQLYGSSDVSIQPVERSCLILALFRGRSILCGHANRGRPP